MSQPAINKLEKTPNAQSKNIGFVAAALGLHVRWLQTGKGEKYLTRTQQPDQLPERSVPSRSTPGQVSIAELEVYAPSGDGGDGERGNAIMANEEAGLIVGVHTMPADSFREAYGFPASRIRIVPVKGTSMVPELWPGQRVMVDIEDKAPSPPGVFVVWDGMALVMKYIEVVANSDPLRVRISSANPAFQPYERTLGEAYINGRVVGKWARL